MAKRSGSASGDYAVGWGKPPVANRFSATNQPKGRGVGFANGRKPAHELERETVSIGRDALKTTRREAMDEALIQLAYRKVAAAKELYARLDEEERVLDSRAAPASVRNAKASQDLKSRILEEHDTYIARAAANGLIVRDLMGSWKVAGWVKHAAAMRPPT